MVHEWRREIWPPLPLVGEVGLSGPGEGFASDFYVGGLAALHHRALLTGSVVQKPWTHRCKIGGEGQSHRQGLCRAPPQLLSRCPKGKI